MVTCICASYTVCLAIQVETTTQKKLAAAGVQHKFISSGKDDYRYVDIVPVRAGKLAALEYGLPQDPLLVGQWSLSPASV